MSGPPGEFVLTAVLVPDSEECGVAFRTIASYLVDGGRHGAVCSGPRADPTRPDPGRPGHYVLIGPRAVADVVVRAAAGPSFGAVGLVLIDPPLDAVDRDVWCPTLLVTGSRDGAVEDAIQVQEQLRGASQVQHVPVPSPHLDDPNRTAAVLRQAMDACAAAISLAWSGTVPREADALVERSRAVRSARPDLGAATDDELVARAGELLPALAEACDRHGAIALAGSVGLAELYRLCSLADSTTTFVELISGLGGTGSAVAALALRELVPPGPARGLDAFLAEHGHHGPDEWDLAAPSWETDPDQALDLVRRMRPPDPAAHRRPGRAAAAAAVRGRLTGRDRADFDTAHAAVADLVPAREHTRGAAVILVNELRMVVRELGRRLVAAGHIEKPADVCVLRATELAWCAGRPDGLAATVADRVAAGTPTRVADFIGPPPAASHGADGAVGRSPGTSAAGPSRGPRWVLTGRAGSRGRHTGRVRVAADVADVRDFAAGDVLVVRAADPAWMPLLAVAGACVTESGGVTSHAMVVCRELGLPGVTGVVGASGVLVDGAFVTVDGDAGTVMPVDPPDDVPPHTGSLPPPVGAG